MEDDEEGLVPFLTYPRRKYWRDEDILRPNSSGRSKAEIASFLQRWLFFGLLSDILRTPIKRSDFVIQNEKDEAVLTTKRLPQLIER